MNITEVRTGLYVQVACMRWNLNEQLAMEEAKRGGGTGTRKRIMKGKIKDERYPEKKWHKMSYVREHPGGAKTEIHYWKPLKKSYGNAHGHKFKNN